MELPLKRNSFFVALNESRADPGFLVFLPNQPVSYVQYKKGGPQAFTLRMRVSSYVSEGGGSVIVATLDDVSHTLRLEDVYVWRGEKLSHSQTFTERRKRLGEFVEQHWIPDARLMGGVLTTVLNPISLEEFSTTTSLDGVASLEFFPDAPGKRRMLFSLLEAKPVAPQQPRGAQTSRPPQMQAQAQVQAQSQTQGQSQAQSQAQPQTEQTRRVRAVPIDKMPDVYDLFGEDNLPISRASIQSLALSQKLRTEVKDKTTGVWVMARWRSEFGGYEISSLA
jgi:hypothetical protein